ncbi:hypothetical protein C8J55DRAFT_496965, partial [Lentinula edodes]
SSLLYSHSPGTNGVTAVLLITSLLSHSTSALRHLVALARLHSVHDLIRGAIRGSTRWGALVLFEETRRLTQMA